jgi:hypothetical protein
MSAGPENRPIGGDAAPEQSGLDLMRPRFDPRLTSAFQGQELVPANRRPTPSSRNGKGGVGLCREIQPDRTTP